MLADRCAAARFGAAWTPSTPFFNGLSVSAPVPVEDGNSPSGAELLGLGVYLAVVLVVPLLIGLAVDGGAHSSPLGLLVGLVVGIVAAVLGLWARLKRYL